MARVQKGAAIPGHRTLQRRNNDQNPCHCGCALGNPLRFDLTAGNSHDCVKGFEMLQEMDLAGKTVIADRGYDMNNILELIEK